MLNRLSDLVNGDADLLRRGQYLTATFIIGIGNTDWLVEIREGQVATVQPEPALMTPSQFSIRASENAWREFWQPVPLPGFHDIFAMTKSGDATVEGDFQPFMANLRYFKDLLAAPRGQI
jgi:hypothetical protein